MEFLFDYFCFWLDNADVLVSKMYGLKAAVWVTGIMRKSSFYEFTKWRPFSATLRALKT